MTDAEFDAWLDTVSALLFKRDAAVLKAME